MHNNELEYSLKNTMRDLAIPGYWIEYLHSSRRLQTIKGEEELWPGCKIIETPGHTPGSISLNINYKDKSLILAGDAVKNRFEVSEGRPKEAFDVELACKTLAKIKDWLI